MPRYFFHLRDGDFHTPDDTGNEFESLEAAELAALTVIDNLCAKKPDWLNELLSPQLDIVGASGEVLSTLPFGVIHKTMN
jgi:hypothetical protein